MILPATAILAPEIVSACSAPGTPNAPPPEPPNCCKPYCTGSPCYVKSGDYQMNWQDLQMPTRGIPLSVGRNYDSQRALDGLFGFGGTSNLTSRITYVTDQFQPPSTYYNEAVIVMPDAKVLRFRENAGGSTFTPPVESHDTLIRNGDGTYDLTLKLSRTHYRYDAQGSLDYILDDFGNTTDYTYVSGKLDRITDNATGRYLTVAYGPNGRISTVTDSAGRTVEYLYNAQGAVTSVIDPDGRTTVYSYVSGHFAPLLSRVTDHWGRIVTDITYDASDRVASYTEAGETYTYAYTSATTTTQTDSSGKTWTFTFDAGGRIITRNPPAGSGGASANYAFNADGSMSRYSDELNIKTDYTYNANGSVATIIRDALGTTTKIRFDYTYDPNFPEKVIAITPKNPSSGTINRDWQEWKYDYYQTGSTAPGALFHVFRIRSDATQQTLSTYTYNSNGQVLTVTDATAGVTTYNYNTTTGDLLSITYPKNFTGGGSGPIYQYGRDAAGRVTSVTDPLGKVTTYTYDDIDRILTVTLPKPSSGSTLNFTTTYSHDNYDAATGLVFTHQTDPNGKLTKQGYDQYGQLVKSIDATNNSTNFAYNKGLLSSITDANGNITGYSYNALRRLTTTTFPDATTESYVYYVDGLLNTRTDRKLQTITYSYDRLKRLTNKAYPNSTSVGYTYLGQKLTGVNDAGDSHSFIYDTSYRMSSNTQGIRGTISYTYDAADRVATLTVTGGPTATYTYFADGSLKKIDWSLVGAGTFDFTYRLNGQYNSVTMGNDQHRDYTYDDQGRLLSIANIHPDDGNLATYAYAYDINHSTGQPTMLGQRTSMTATVPYQNLNNHLTKYYYDNHYQLTRTDYPNVAPLGGEVHSWTYDPIGNRLTNTVNSTTQTYTYFKHAGNPNNGQRLQSDGVNSYTYDNNGNTATKTGSTFTWDYENRLSGISGGSTASYTYDYMGRRISKIVSGVTTTYLYHGQNLIREMSSTNADFLYGPGIDEPFAIDRAGTTYYYDTDGLGSISLLNKRVGPIQNSYVYDAWGTVRSQTTPTTNPFTYTARETGEAGLMFYRARYYNPGVGRFVSMDPVYSITKPIGLHRYAYVGNDPNLYVDPLGLFSIDGSCKSGGFENLGIPEAVKSLCKGPKCKVILQKMWVGGSGDSLWQCIEKYCKSKKNTIYCGPCTRPRDEPCGMSYGQPEYNPSAGLRLCQGNLSGNPTTCPCEEDGLTIEVTIFHEVLHLCGLVAEPGSGSHLGNILGGLVKKCYGYNEP